MQKKDRIIVHSDINHCYAQIEEMKYPGLRDVPMAVGGNEEERQMCIRDRVYNHKLRLIQLHDSLLRLKGVKRIK